MHQKNALALLDRVTGKDGALADDIGWGDVPRFWSVESDMRRAGDTRDGSAPALPPANTSMSDVAAGAIETTTSDQDRISDDCHRIR